MVERDEITSADASFSQQPCLSGRQVSLAEVLDRVLNKGAVVTGDIMISVAGIDLLYVGLSLLVASVETVKRQGTKIFSTREKVYGA